MACSQGIKSVKQEEWNKLLVNLKTTVEGLLSMPCSNVWSIFGGLDRLSRDLEQIMYHGQKVVMSQNVHGKPKDFWDFVKGLRWLNPVMAPSIERYSKISPDTRGKVWIRQSLQDYNIVNQLSILVENKPYLQQYYQDEAFLCQSEYFQCMIICLQAVEQNKPGLLADINPHLLNKPLHDHPAQRANPNSEAPPYISLQEDCAGGGGSTCSPHTVSNSIHIHTSGSTSLPATNDDNADEMFRRSAPHDPLAPPMLALKTESVLLLSDGHAVIKPSSYGSSSDESAKEALLQLLSKSGDALDDEKPSVYPTTYNNVVSNDPLMNTKPSSDILAYDRKSMRPKKKSRHKENHDKQNADTKPHQTVNDLSNSTKVLDNILNCDEPNVIQSNETIDIENLSSSHSTNRITYCESFDREPTNQNAKYSSKVPASPDSGYATFRHDRNGTKASKSHPAHEKQQVKKADSEVQLDKFYIQKGSHQRSMSDYGLPAAKRSEERSGSTISTSVPKYSKEDVRRSSFFHQPTKGESLIGFLSSQDFHTCAELDKENAHFSICETLICAIEQMKWNQVIHPPVTDDLHEGDSDEEIQVLKQRIRIRRQEKLKLKASAFLPFDDGLTELTRSTGSQHTADSNSELSDLPESGGSSDEVHDAELNEAETSLSDRGSNLESLKESGLSLSLASLYSEIEIQKHNKSMERREAAPASPHTSYMSAESVAISLLKKFSENQLPKASDLEWLVSEQDAPQRLLPLPDSFPVSPDDNENADLLKARTRIRGNLEWAPPRPQIIFNIHAPPKRKVLLARQNYRCAGCGTKVEHAYIGRYRFCEYLGKYFCPCCHSNDVAYIPGKILRKWDFTKYYVSHFAHDLLAKIYKEPFFSIIDINPGLYKKVRHLDQIRDYRSQFTHLVTFLRTCRLGEQLYKKVDSYPSHWKAEVHMYSVKELVEVRSGTLVNVFKDLVTQCIQHISQCQLCQAKGFICEFCNNCRDIIFPFELGRVDLCPLCRACFHKTCFVPEKCPKCIRIESRKHKLEGDD